MRVLLDECLPRKLKGHVQDHQVSTVPEMSWAGTKNGELLRLAASYFDVFVTVDQNLTFQQNLSKTAASTSLSIVVLVAASNRLEALLHLIPEMQQVLPTLQPGQVVRVGS